MMNTFISKFAIIPPNKQVVTKERLRLTMTVMVIQTGLVKLAVSSGAVSSVLLYCCTAPLLAVASSEQ